MLHHPAGSAQKHATNEAVSDSQAVPHRGRGRRLMCRTGRLHLKQVMLSAFGLDSVDATRSSERPMSSFFTSLARFCLIEVAAKHLELSFDEFVGDASHSPLLKALGAWLLTDQLNLLAFGCPCLRLEKALAP
jgi:hypothetical protein